MPPVVIHPVMRKGASAARVRMVRRFIRGRRLTKNRMAARLSTPDRALLFRDGPRQLLEFPRLVRVVRVGMGGALGPESPVLVHPHPLLRLLADQLFEEIPRDLRDLPLGRPFGD